MKADLLKKILSESTLSSSGWRRIFHTRKPLNPNSTAASLDKGISYFLHTAFEVIADYFKSTLSAKKLQLKPTVVIARDSRPTGAKAIAILKSTLSKKKIFFLDLGVTSIPECVAITKIKSIGGLSFKGFIYLTASHNPPGYNGIKVGNSSGRIISSHVNATLIKQFKKLFLKENHTDKLNKPIKKFDYKTDKIKLKDYYHTSILRTLGKGKRGGKKSYQELVEKIKNNNYAIGCDFNGSARINSIDKDFFTSLGFKFFSIGNRLGKFDHDIVPEGKSLLSLQKAIQDWSKKQILFGYTVDCDGDRGNLVIQVPLQTNSLKTKVVTPDAQTTFAFSVLAELCYTATFTPKLLKKTAIVVNGPTSLRIDNLAKAFNVKVFRAEVGEINVVTLASKIKQQGYHVPILGEGSNGGSIIPPSTIRDPLSTAASLIKLMFLRYNNISLRDIAVKKLNAPKMLLSMPLPYFLGALLPYLNTFTSTSVFESNALLSTNCSSQKNFKQIYSELFTQYWKKHFAIFKKMGFSSYSFILYEQIETINSGEEINLFKKKHQPFEGGFKVSFYSSTKAELGFVWFRFSKTEPVLRLSAEHKLPKHQQNLFNIHRQLLKETANVDKQKNL